jgi:hypothetical protein
MDIFNHEDDRRHRLFNGRQRDPTRQGKKTDTPYFRKGHGRVLMPDSFMPVGEHAGKHLRAVPTEYLLWVDAQPWSRQWTPWQPVHDFIERFITPDPETANTADLPTGPIIFLAPAHNLPASINDPSFLHCLPGNEDLLHTFAIGAINFKTALYIRRPFPHYPLPPSKTRLALQNGAHPITPAALRDNQAQWRIYFQTNRQFVPES